MSQLGGFDNVVTAVVEHAQARGQAVTEDEAVELLNEWRLRGIVHNISLGEWLDGVRVTRPDD